MDWLPDMRVGTFELRDLVSLGMAGLGAYLAWLAITMGREQARISKEQTEIAKRQESLDIEQAKIAKRQAEIAEIQYQIFQEELAIRPKLMISTSISTNSDESLNRADNICISINNEGKTPAVNVFFEIRLTTADAGKLQLERVQSGQIIRPHGFSTETHLIYSGTLSKPLAANEQMELFKVTGKRLPSYADLNVERRITCNGARFPSSGEFTKVDFAWLDNHFNLLDSRLQS